MLAVVGDTQSVWQFPWRVRPRLGLQALMVVDASLLNEVSDDGVVGGHVEIPRQDDRQMDRGALSTILTCCLGKLRLLEVGY